MHWADHLGSVQIDFWSSFSLHVTSKKIERIVQRCVPVHFMTVTRVQRQRRLIIHNKSTRISCQGAHLQRLLQIRRDLTWQSKIIIPSVLSHPYSPFSATMQDVGAVCDEQEFLLSIDVRGSSYEQNTHSVMHHLRMECHPINNANVRIHSLAGQQYISRQGVGELDLSCCRWR